MNVKNKVISFIMSFLIVASSCFGSFANDKEYIDYNSLAPVAIDGGVISVPMLATVASVAVGTGLVLKNNDELYNIGRMFYDYVKNHNELTWDFVQSAFISGHTVINNYVHVDSDFLSIVKGFLKSKFGGNVVPVGYYGDIPVYSDNNAISSDNEMFTIDLTSFPQGHEGWLCPNILYYVDLKTDDYTRVKFYRDKRSVNPIWSNEFRGVGISLYAYYDATQYQALRFRLAGDKDDIFRLSFSSMTGELVTAPGGVWNWDKLQEKVKDGKVALPVPSDLGTLVNKGSDDFWANETDLVGTGAITKPVVSNPSIETVDDVFVQSGSTDIPGDVPGDIPGDVPGIVFPPFGGGLDFSPITQSSFTDKFPFSLGKDIKNITSVFDVDPKAPKFTVPIVSEELEIDLTQFNVWASIIRFFVLIGFMISLINITRKVIG